jgi:hypothetical protein
VFLFVYLFICPSKCHLSLFVSLAVLFCLSIYLSVRISICQSLSLSTVVSAFRPSVYTAVSALIELLHPHSSVNGRRVTAVLNVIRF